ncbi:MAG: hypothetical protein JSR17_12625 [Proteobacteria bacterium]|nr:hypothetical protein [Pseudomonadota bacterium]
MGQSNAWSSVGDLFVPIAIVYDRLREYRVGLFTRSYQTIEVRLKGFEILSNRIPPHWTTKIVTDTNSLFCMPARWQDPNFFEEYDDGCPRANEIFLEELVKTYAFEGMPLP